MFRIDALTRALRGGAETEGAGGVCPQTGVELGFSATAMVL